MVLLAIQHELANHFVRLAERHALLGQVVGHVGRGREALAGRLAHLGHVQLHAFDHALHAHHAVVQGFRGVHGAFLAFLQVFIVGKR